MRGLTLLVVALAAWSGVAAAETSVRVGIGTSGMQFDFLYSDYDADPVLVQREAVFVGEPDVLVALHLARISRVDVDVIIGWRRAGMSWDRITRRCDRDARIYFIDVPDDISGPPYGRARGHWKKHPRGDLALSDAEIREFVLVQALAAHSKLPVSEVVRQRVTGTSPRAIATKQKGRSEDAAPKVPAASRGAGKGKTGEGKANPNPGHGKK